MNKNDRPYNGAVVIARFRDIILASWRGEFVTWHLNALGATTSGRYFRDFNAAQSDYTSRIVHHS